MQKKKILTATIDAETFNKKVFGSDGFDNTEMDASEFVNNLSDKNITIKKAKIKDGLFLEAEYSEELPGHGTKATKLSCTVPVHDDLKEAFKKLIPHLIVLCDEGPSPKIGEIESVNTSNFEVRSFSLGGNGDNEGVTISGYKEGQFGIINLNTPFIQYGNEDYKHRFELSASVEVCIYEVKQYLFHGKKAPEQQLELNFDQDQVMDVEVEEA